MGKSDQVITGALRFEPVHGEREFLATKNRIALSYKINENECGFCDQDSASQVLAIS
jgi:hypothetical protein